jgi:hypothetical protein
MPTTRNLAGLVCGSLEADAGSELTDPLSSCQLLFAIKQTKIHFRRAVKEKRKRTEIAKLI